MPKVFGQSIPALFLDDFMRFLQPGMTHGIGYNFYGIYYSYATLTRKQPHVPLRRGVPPRDPIFR